jgi:hypothetical protein
MVFVSFGDFVKFEDGHKEGSKMGKLGERSGLLRSEFKF